MGTTAVVLQRQDADRERARVDRLSQGTFWDAKHGVMECEGGREVRHEKERQGKEDLSEREDEACKQEGSASESQEGSAQSSANTARARETIVLVFSWRREKAESQGRADGSAEQIVAVPSARSRIVPAFIGRTEAEDRAKRGPQTFAASARRALPIRSPRRSKNRPASLLTSPKRSS